MISENTVVQKVSEDKCTGCAACMNVCPTLAISMRENPEGFPMRSVDASLCVDCGKCIAVCPVLHVAQDNNPNPGCYAFRASDEIRAHSSSGGVFTVLAQKTLEEGGAVCGAIYDGDFGVELTLAENWDGVAPMRGSKYVQSDAGFIYKKIKTLLDGGRKVLFTGTPCQVAGLNAFLGKRYENLLTSDLICHGVPSQKLLQRHLAEVAKGRQVESVAFRDKRYGWTATTLHVEFGDGSIYTGRDAQDAYERGFHPNLFLRKSCEDCPFCSFPRQGDLSLGDFWGFDKIAPEHRDGKGTSLVFTNNEKGKNALESLKKDALFCEEVKCDIRALPNRLHRGLRKNPNRERFFALASRMPFAEAVRYATEKFYDVGCVGFYSDGNFGSVLTYYALYNVLEDLGYSTLMIDRPLSGSYIQGNFEEIFEKGTYPEYARAPVFPNRPAMRELNKNTDTFLVGADQLFNPFLYTFADRVVSLDWVQDNKKKLAYAASFGKDTLNCSDDLRADMSFFVKKYDAFSVREKSGIDICRAQLGIDAVHVMDPVFLCDIKHYERFAALAGDSESEEKEWVGAYILDPDDVKQRIIEDVCAEFSLPHKIHCERGNKKPFYLSVLHGSYNQQLRDMMESSFFVTDSFHGVCFSIIFRKPFVAYGNSHRGNARFLSILSDTGLKDRLIHSWDEFYERRESLLKPIDYDAVYAKLKPLVEGGRNWLKEQLEKPIVKSASDYDLMIKIVRGNRWLVQQELTTQANKITGLEERIHELEKKLEWFADRNTQNHHAK